MRKSTALGCVSGLALLVAGQVLAAGDGVLRYRGKYTYGHEVNIFCPDGNSQCYWLGEGTADDVRATLKELATTSGSAPYHPLCVVIEGRIDRITHRTGFAADYNGLISVSWVFGNCGETDIVTQGDLQHHRWLLESINGNALASAEQGGMIPELDFGERMTVTGNSGCNRLSGQGVLREDYLVFDRLVSTRRMCAPPHDEIERTVLRVLGSESVVKITSERQLVLHSDQTTLSFRLQDWTQ